MAAGSENSVPEPHAATSREEVGGEAFFFFLNLKAFPHDVLFPACVCESLQTALATGDQGSPCPGLWGTILCQTTTHMLEERKPLKQTVPGKVEGHL